MTSDSAFKGLYCTELRSLQDNAQHPVAIQTFFTTLSNVSFFPLARFLPWQTQRTMARPPAPFMVTIFAHDKVHSSRFATSPHLPAPPLPALLQPLTKNETERDFPTITVTQTSLVFNVLFQGWYLTFEKLICCFQGLSNQQRIKYGPAVARLGTMEHAT